MVDELNSLLLDISKELKDDNLRNLTFLCNGVVGKKHLENVKSGIDLFQHLKEMNKITRVDTAYLHELLLGISRSDLAEKVTEFQRQHGCATSPSIDEREQEKLTIVSDILVDNLGKDWRKFARKLGLQEGHLEQIEEKHRYNLNEKVMEVIAMWTKMRKGDVKADQLIDALRSCKLIYTAESVERELKSKGFS